MNRDQSGHRRSSGFRLGLMLFVLCGLAMGNVGCSKEARRERRLTAGDAAFLAGEYDKAEIEYLNALKLDPKQALPLERLGIIYLEQGRTLRAFAALARAKELESTNPEVRLKLALVYAAEGQPKEAQEEINEVVKVEPGNAQALVMMAELTRTPAEAAALRKRMAELQSKAGEQPGFHAAEGVLRARENKLAEAEQAFLRAVKLDPKLAEAHVALASIAWARGDTNRADLAFQQAVDSSPVRSGTRLRYIEFKRRTAGVEEARKALEALTDQAPDFVTAWQELAQLAFAEKRYDDSRKCLERILAREPTHFPALLLGVRLRLAKGELEAALNEANQLATRYEMSPLAHQQLAIAQLLNKDATKAMDSLRQAISLNPGYTEAILLLAELQTRRGDAAAAIPALVQLTNRQPNVVQAYYALAEAYRIRGNPDAALAIYRDLAQRFTNDFRPKLLTGIMLRQQQRLPEARQAFEQVVRLQPDYLPATEQLVRLDLLATNFPAALKRVQAQRQRQPKVAGLAFLEGQVYLAQGDQERAEAAMVKAIELDPGYRPAQMALASLYANSNKQKEALARLEALLAKNPGDATARMQVGMIQNVLGDYAAAKAAYEMVLSTNANYVPALNNLAYLEAEHLGNVDRAYELARKARELAPKDPYTADTLGWVAYRRGEYPWALTLIKESAESLSAEPEVQYHLGMSHYMMGEEDAARSALREALEPGLDFRGKEEAQRRLAVLESPAGTTDPAVIATLEKAVGADDKDLIALSRLAVCYERSGKADKAVPLYEKVLVLNPKLAGVTAQLAWLYAERLNDPQKALALARTARNLAPNAPDVGWKAGRAAYLAGDHSWARSLLEDSARQRSDDPEVLFDFAMASYSVGQTTNAVAAVESALQAGSGFARAPAAQRFLGMARLAEDPVQAATAVAQVQQALKDEPELLPALVAQARALESQQKAADARASYERILARYPGFTPGTRSLAVLLMADPKEDAKTLELVRKAREASPGDPVLNKVYGVVLYRRSDWAGAARALKDASAKLPEDAEVFYRLGMAQHQLKQAAESKAALERALALAPNSPWAADVRKLITPPK